MTLELGKRYDWLTTKHREYMLCKTIPTSDSNFLKSLRLKFEGT